MRYPHELGNLIFMDFKANLVVNILRQGKRYIAHAPALDISTSGKSPAEARKRFAELVPVFFEELEEGGTTKEVLTELGWKHESSVSKSATAGWRPPEVKSERMQVRIPITT